MKSYGSRLLTLLLALCIFLSFTLPAFGDVWRPAKPPKPAKELDENPFPHIASKPKFMLVFNAQGSLFLLPFSLVVSSTSGAEVLQRTVATGVKSGAR